jgi:hypothetical protein
MNRPPLWIWALPACLALGLLIGARLPSPAPAPAAAGEAALADSGRSPLPAPTDSGAPERVPLQTPDAEFVDWGWDGGSYGPVSGWAADTLPPAPAVSVVEGAAEEASAEPNSSAAARTAAPAPAGPGPVQELSAAAGLARPLIGAVRGGGRLSYYAAWPAPSSRVSLVGRWAAVGECAGSVRLDYEQPAPGVGAVRGVGHVEEGVDWSVALLVPRQHCSEAALRWVEARAPRAAEVDRLEVLSDGQPPAAVVLDGDLVWIAWPRRAMLARVREGSAVELWSDTPGAGATVRLLGVWDGDGVWVSSEPGGRILRVWRVPVARLGVAVPVS